MRSRQAEVADEVTRPVQFDTCTSHDSDLANIDVDQSEHSLACRSSVSYGADSTSQRVLDASQTVSNMKAAALILLFVFCSIECRKVVPINKNANIDFINMESGGVRSQPAVPSKQPVPVPAAPKQPAPAPTPAPAASVLVTKLPTPVPAPKPVAPQPAPQKPVQPVPSSPKIKPVPVNPAPVANPITTPGPGSVKSLITFYDSQGKASPIRPYSYSQAVKQG